MKTFLLFLSLLVTTTLCAQTYASNDWFKLEFAGVVDNSYTFYATNKQSCAADPARISVDNKNYFEVLQPGERKLVSIPFTTYKAGIEIKIKTEITCVGAGGNSGWLSITTPSLQILPLKEPVAYTPPKKGSNDVVFIRDVMGRFVRATREKNLMNDTNLLSRGQYLFIYPNKVVRWTKL